MSDEELIYEKGRLMKERNDREFTLEEIADVVNDSKMDSDEVRDKIKRLLENRDPSDFS
jgi:hypothetical protein